MSNITPNEKGLSPSAKFYGKLDGRLLIGFGAQVQFQHKRTKEIEDGIFFGYNP